jgi:CIC family chloride channel protein
MVAGALAGLAGSAFRITLARAKQMRDALAEWAHQWPEWGRLIPVLAAALCAALARWLVRWAECLEKPATLVLHRAGIATRRQG